MKPALLVGLMLISLQVLFAQTFEELIDKGDEFYNETNYPEAVKYFTQAINLNPKLLKGYWYRADAYRQNNEYAEATKDYTKALEFEPQNVKFLMRRGDCYYNINQYLLAERDYTKGIELEEANAKLWLYRGDCFAKLEETEKACSDYKKAFELGDKSAKGQAKELNCEWIKSLQPKPCPTGEAAISTVEVDKFTGAVIISKGLVYKEFEIKTEAEGTRVTGSEFAIGESFVFKITYPTNFCANEDDEVFIGTGFTMLNDAGKELGAVANIYEEEQGMQQEFLKSMSATLDFRAPMEVGKKYLIKVRFFDIKGNGEVLVELPFKLASRTQTDSYTMATQGKLGTGISTASVDIDASAFEIKKKGKPEVIKTGVLARNSIYSVTLTTSKNPAPGSSVLLRLIDRKGTIVSEQSVKVIVTGSKAQLDFNTQNLAIGSYQLWMRLIDPASVQSLGLVAPIVIK